MQIISIKRLAFLFNIPIDSVYCGIVFMYAQQLDEVYKFMLMCYLVSSIFAVHSFLWRISICPPSVLDHMLSTSL